MRLQFLAVNIPTPTFALTTRGVHESDHRGKFTVRVSVKKALVAIIGGNLARRLTGCSPVFCYP